MSSGNASALQHDDASGAAHRSVPNQIEFWAALGHAGEGRLTATETRDLLSGERFVARVECAVATSIEPDDVFAALEADRVSGALADRMPRWPVRYDAAGAPEGLVRRIDTNGAESFGRFEGGVWRPGDDRD